MQHSRLKQASCRLNATVVVFATLVLPACTSSGQGVTIILPMAVFVVVPLLAFLDLYWYPTEDGRTNARPDEWLVVLTMLVAIGAALTSAFSNGAVLRQGYFNAMVSQCLPTYCTYAVVLWVLWQWVLRRRSLGGPIFVTTLLWLLPAPFYWHMQRPAPYSLRMFWELLFLPSIEEAEPGTVVRNAFVVLDWIPFVLVLVIAGAAVWVRRRRKRSGG